ncbi:peptidoglycan hydrolase-like protein with peptidoglycan-binding domain [Aquibacillus albus]|uniref:N-acetylmuramoyl-L-alanine amidase n=2 Tax=Aquibacillus albus TaxID=1168171 RepID=A0ABS2N5K6_9BACI|nr:peptidoglycan hydrolase-like protein with peptidoglycan-binding domain [Aquibacillus albus]
MKYEITRDYIEVGNSRPGEKLDEVKFIVSHDTGNPGSTAYANRNYFANTQPSASSHTFIDDQYILEIIPLDEKAYHVRSNVPEDNRRFGANANNAAIGVELAFGGSINFSEAYDRYVWYHAYLLDRFNLEAGTDIVAHSTLDPSRRTDPQNALHRNGVSWDQFINDVKQMYDAEFSAEETGESDVLGESVELPLSIGDEGPFVREIQQDLIRAGFSLPRYGADGTFGEETEGAVMQFQRAHGLTVDGLVGPITLEKLNEVLDEGQTTENFSLPSGILRQGDEGEAVKQLQRALKQVNFDPQGIDGIYGPNTEDAVRRFQSMHRDLENDGIYGPETRRFLRMELDDLA